MVNKIDNYIKPRPRYDSFSDNLYWAYACWQAFWVAAKDGELKFGRKHFMIRAKFFKGYREGKYHATDLYRNNIAKMQSNNMCWYCQSELTPTELTADHVFPRIKGGTNDMDNIIFACKHCNSSKGAKDMVEWFVERNQIPHYWLIGHYLKQVVQYAEEYNLMDKSLDEVAAMELPFSIKSILFFHNRDVWETYLNTLYSEENLNDVKPDELSNNNVIQQ